jgi:hypothetical protein
VPTAFVLGAVVLAIAAATNTTAITTSTTTAAGGAGADVATSPSIRLPNDDFAANLTQTHAASYFKHVRRAAATATPLKREGFCLFCRNILIQNLLGDGLLDKFPVGLALHLADLLEHFSASDHKSLAAAFP